MIKAGACEEDLFSLFPSIDLQNMEGTHLSCDHANQSVNCVKKILGEYSGKIYKLDEKFDRQKKSFPPLDSEVALDSFKKSAEIWPH